MEKIETGEAGSRTAHMSLSTPFPPDRAKPVTVDYLLQDQTGRGIIDPPVHSVDSSLI
ncbi:MAG: hypothetical protein ACOXZ6_02490 [Syntrophomonadaceae bacterium]